MLGAIIGDIVGSRFEFHNHRSKEFELFTDDCFVTDDSIMSLAVAKAIMEAAKNKPPLKSRYDSDFLSLLSDLTVKNMQELGRKYPNCGFGGMFKKWVFSDDPKPYNSFGNGAAMRISPVGFAAWYEWEAEQQAFIVTAVTHNHEEGIKGAKATAAAIVLARKGAVKEEIREYISSHYYPLNFRIDDIRATYKFDVTCQGTVPQAIECFLEATSFEDAIRTAISLGGDSDTIGAITGAIAEAYYGIPEDIREKALNYLDEELRPIYDEWCEFAPPCDEQFRVLTKYIGWLSDRKMIGNHTIEYMDYFPFSGFESDWISSAFPHRSYQGCLAGMSVEMNYDSIVAKDVADLDASQVLALMTAAFRQDHFDNGALIKYYQSGTMLKWLKRLKDIDWQRHPRRIVEVELELSGMGSLQSQRISLGENDAIIYFEHCRTSVDEEGNVDIVRQALEELHFEYWLSRYPQEGGNIVCDGEQWGLTVEYDDGTEMVIDGDNTYPENWTALLDIFGIDYGDDDDEYNRQPGELIFLSVSFDGGKTYYYTTEDESIEIGDVVIVPAGANNTERKGTVEDITYFYPEFAPLPLEQTKAIIRRAPDVEATEGDNTASLIDENFLVINEPFSVDVLDERLYSFESAVFTLAPAIQQRVSESLLQKVMQFLYSVPAAEKTSENLKRKIEYNPRFDLLSDEIQQALQNGNAEIIQYKGSTNTFYLQIRSTIKGLVINGKEYGKHRKIKDIPLGAKQVPVDVAGAMQCLAIQSQLNQIANGIREISEVCDFNFGRIIQGQRDDRHAKLLSGRSNLIQALAVSDDSLRRQMLTQAVCDANSARAELAYQIRSDILSLNGEKQLKTKQMDKIVFDINTAIIVMNNAVELSLYSYQVLGEYAAQLSVVKEHETFIRQVLLHRFERGYTAWGLICSSRDGRTLLANYEELPSNLLKSYVAFIEDRKAYYLEDKSGE